MADITAPMYMDFSIPTLSVSDLAAGDHNTGGSWSTVDPNMSLDVGGKIAIPGTVNGVADTSTQGMAYDSTGGTGQGQKKFNFAAVDVVSFGFGLIACSLTSPRTFTEYDIVEWSGVSGNGFYLKHHDNGGSNDLSLFDNVSSGRQVVLTLTSAQKYWITGRWTRGASTLAEVKVYNATTWVLLATSSRSMASNQQCSAIGWGPLVGGAQSNPVKHYYAQLMVDDVSAVYPLVPEPRRFLLGAH